MLRPEQREPLGFQVSCLCRVHPGQEGPAGTQQPLEAIPFYWNTTQASPTGSGRMVPHVCIQSNDSQVEAGWTVGRQPGCGVRWTCGLKEKPSHTCSQVGHSHQCGVSRGKRELGESPRSCLFSGDWLCFLKAQEYPGTQLWCRSEPAPLLLVHFTPGLAIGWPPSRCLTNADPWSLAPTKRSAELYSRQISARHCSP